jgi:hypothetical protein
MIFAATGLVHRAHPAQRSGCTDGASRRTEFNLSSHLFLQKRRAKGARLTNKFSLQHDHDGGSREDSCNNAA